MVFRDWEEAVKNLSHLTGPATIKQQKLGELIGMPVKKEIPKIIAAASLRLNLATELDLCPSPPVTEKSENILQFLIKPGDSPISPKTEEEAVAWISYLRFKRRSESLSDLKLHEGDIVETAHGELAEVSSINDEGRVFFKGGQGFASWPDQLCIMFRVSDKASEAVKAKKEAENIVTRRKKSSVWSNAKGVDLSEFIVENTPTEDEIVELETIISNSVDEKPIQKYLEKNRHILTCLLGGRNRYCLPQKRLGGEYIPDFLIGETDSLGFRWILIELETPKTGIYLKNGKDFDEKTRKGVSQVIDWRNWLSDNITYARQQRANNGLGLFDIREKTDGLVLVGKRSLMPATKDAQRAEYRQNSNILIHSYDWLIDNLIGAMRYTGLPAKSPYIIHY